MTDYGRALQFGYFLTPEAKAPVVRIAQDADRRGLDLIGIQDHPYQRRYGDTLALIGAILAKTSRVRVFPDVACLPLRLPTVLAKTMATLDVLSGGRVELGLGAGAFWDAIEAYGGPRRSTGEAREALEEAIQVIRLTWSGVRGLRFEGKHYRVLGIHSGPVPAHVIDIWLGVTGPKALTLTGRMADGWVPSSPYVPPHRLPKAHALIDEGALAADREPAAIRRIYNVAGTIDERASRGFLNGPVQQWVDELTELAVGHGMDTFIFAGDPVRDLPSFAEEIVPGVREQVAKERANNER